MFTGIVEEMGSLAERDGARLTVGARTAWQGTVVGDSIALNGCCLTVVDVGEGWWQADVVDETLSRTNLGAIAIGDPVNLERSVRLGDRLGGHLVLGHVDTVGEVVQPAPLLQVRVPARWLRYVVEKGSVTIDGCSLTVVDLLDDGFTVAIVPHTADVTTLGSRRQGDPVNVEFDMIAKYVEGLLRDTGPVAP